MKLKAPLLFLICAMSRTFVDGQSVSPGLPNPPEAVPRQVGITPMSPLKAAPPDNGPAFYPNDAMRWRYTAVKEYMRHKSPIGPVGSGVLASMGDESAFHVYVLVKDRLPLPTDEAMTVLDIVHNSFKIPAAIQQAADRRPEKSLALLMLIQASATNQVVKERIATETAFLKTVPEKIMAPPLVLTSPPKPGVMPNSADFPAAKP